MNTKRRNLRSGFTLLEIMVLIVIIGILAALTIPTARAQSSNTNSPTGNFFTSMQDYFTSFNTNNDSTFRDQRGKLFTGVVSIQGGAVPLANELTLTYDVYKPTNSSISIAVENEILNSGVAGTIVSEEIGGGLNFIVHDVELTMYAHGGYDFTVAGKKDSPYFGTIGLRALKALTAHTYAGTGISVILPKNEQRFEALAGFTF